MQIISLAVLAAGAAHPADVQPVLARLGEFIRRDDVQWLRNYLIAAIVVTQLLNIAWCWIASKIVVRGENATLANAAKVWLASLLLPLAVGTGLFFFGPLVVENLRDAGPATVIAMIGVFFLALLMLFLFIPIKIYKIGFLNAIGFILLTIIISAVGNGCAEFVAGNVFRVESHLEALKTSFGRTDEERRAFAERLFGKDAPDEIDRLLDAAAQPIGNPKPLAERETAIQAIQQKLEARRRTLPPADREALAAFQLRLDRYVRLLNQVKTERAAQLAPPKKP